MITRSVQPSPPLAADGAALARVLHQAGVAKDSLIWVTGPAGLAVLIWLGREGYHQASYAHANRIAAMGAADALLIPHLSQVGDLPALLPVAGLVREGGMLVVRAGLPADAAEAVAAFATPFGYDLQPHFIDRGRVVYIARRAGVAAQRRAA